MENTHERALPAPAAEVGRLLDRLASADDPLWPSPWPPMRFTPPPGSTTPDRPLQVGADGGHGAIRYHVTAYQPGRLLECTTHPRIGLTGTHTFEVLPTGDDSCVLRHRITGRAHGRMRVLWPLAVRACHDAVLEHLLDNAERAVTGAVAHPVRYPLRVRLILALSRAADHEPEAATSRVRSCGVPGEAVLLHEALPRPDLADAYTVTVAPGVGWDPEDWADAVFRDPPPVVNGLFRLRNALVAPFGIAPGDRSAFGTVARSEREVLLGTDAGHLDFRASVLVSSTHDRTTVTVSTHATARSRAGRAYLSVVELAHPAVVKAMLRRAAGKASVPDHHPDTSREGSRSPAVGS